MVSKGKPTPYFQHLPPPRPRNPPPCPAPPPPQKLASAMRSCVQIWATVSSSPHPNAQAGGRGGAKNKTRSSSRETNSTRFSSVVYLVG